MSLFSSSPNYLIENKNPFRVVMLNAKGRLLLPVILLLFLAWGVCEYFLVYLQYRSVVNIINGHTSLIGVGLGTEASHPVLIVDPFLWLTLQCISIALLIGGAFCGWFLFEEFLWRLMGKETLTITRESIVWTRYAGFVRCRKTYPVNGLQRVQVWKPEFVSRLDLIRPTLVFYRGMGSGAISLEYAKKIVSVGGLITSTEATTVLHQLREAFFLGIPVEI
jgi:hypothetical protein